MEAKPLEDLSKLCIHTITTRPWSLDDAIRHYSAAGVAGISVWRQAIEGMDPAEAGRRIREAGMSVVSLVRGGFYPAVERKDRKRAVEENLRIGLPVRKDRRKDVPEFIFDLFPVLKEMLGRKGGDLSGGQQQQLAIGRALVVDPKLLILDEPTEGIQPNIVQEIGDIILRLNREIGVTVLLVEQKLPFARKVADHFSILDRGRNAAAGAMTGLDDELIRQYLTV